MHFARGVTLHAPRGLTAKSQRQEVTKQKFINQVRASVSSCLLRSRPSARAVSKASRRRVQRRSQRRPGRALRGSHQGKKSRIVNLSTRFVPPCLRAFCEAGRRPVQSQSQTSARAAAKPAVPRRALRRSHQGKKSRIVNL